MSHMQPTGQTVVKDKHGVALNSSMGIIAWVIAIITVGYMLPWAVAVTRGKTNSAAIFLLNLFLGFTVIGWIIALVMACSAHQVAVVTTYSAVQVPRQQLGAAAPGWFPQADGSQRYWDGSAWTHHAPATQGEA